MLLENKIALISGVGNRFGKAAAYLFAQEGAHVVLMSRKEDTVGQISRDIISKGGKSSYIICNATDAQDSQQAIEKIIEKHGKIDILLNNAGGMYTKKAVLHEMSEEAWDEVIHNNLKSVFLMSKYVIPHMKQTGGSIINISAAPKTLIDSNVAYASAKSGIIGLTQNLAREVRPYNIRVNCIRPGVIRNDFNQEQIQTAAALTRKGNSEDVGYAALYFGSDHASWVTGQCLTVDGGEALFLPSEDNG